MLLCTRSVKLFFLIIGVIITGSIEHICIPIMASIMPSLYFLSVLIALEGLLLYTIIMIVYTLYTYTTHDNIFKIQIAALKIAIINGIVSAVMSFCLLYSANPIRTPTVIQSIFLGMTIIPSIIFTKIILKKNVKYNYFYAIPSLVFLLISIGFSIIPLFQETDFKKSNIGWIIIYSGGIIMFSLSNILQEAYIIETTDLSLINKFRLAFYSGLFQVLAICSCFWIDIFIGYSKDMLQFKQLFLESINVLFDNPLRFLLIQLFIFDCLALFIISIYLNEISTNYNMILTNLTNQSVALFFTIFPSFNNGLQYPLSITMLSMLCNIISVILWIKGEPTDIIPSELVLLETNIIPSKTIIIV